MHRPYFFMNGRKGKYSGPGFLIIEDKYKFNVNKTNKDRTTFYMTCSMKRHPEFPCPAKARVCKLEDGHYTLLDFDEDHSHSSIEAQIKAEEMKQNMEDIVRKDPAAPVGEAIKKIKMKLGKEFLGEDEERLMEVISALGSKSGIQKRLYRIRKTKLGSNPKRRKDFKVMEFLDEVFGEDNKLIVMDSDEEMEWDSVGRRGNPNTKYNWSKITEELLDYDREEDDPEEEDEEDGIDENDDPEDLIEEPQGTEESAEDQDTERVLVFTTMELLKLLSQTSRGSVDGTFKSSCRLWKQNFILMVKFKGIWIPVCWGWLPNKKELAYKKFLQLILKKMEALGLTFNLKELICDYEINIHKAIDDLLPWIVILGCFFHLVKAFKKKVFQKHMKRYYMNNDKFRRFIKQASALSFLPLDDLESSFRCLFNSFSFTENKITEFADWFLQYIRKYWIEGVFPPHVLSTWGRTSDLTNNNQEGFNSRYINLCTFNSLAFCLQLKTIHHIYIPSH